MEFPSPVFLYLFLPMVLVGYHLAPRLVPGRARHSVASAFLFAASVLIRAAFERAGVLIGAKYVSSHDSVYRSVAAGLYPAGGGVVRTFENMPAEVRDQLRILWTTPDYTPHAIAARPSVGADTVSALVEAMVGLANDTAGRAVLEPVGFKGIDAAQDSDWDDVRALGLELLDALVAEPQ